MPQPKRRGVSLRKTLAIAAPAVALALALPSGEARASGFSTARFGGEHGHPTTSNATAIYYNPAGIAGSEGIHIFVDGNIAFRASSYEHAEAATDIPEPAGAEGGNNGQGTLLNVAAAPMIGVTGKFGDFAAGLGFYVPFGGVATWDKNPSFEGTNCSGATAPQPCYPGVEDGPQRWFAIDGTLRSSFITAAVAYHIAPARLSVGVSGNLILSTVDTLRARTSDGSNNIDSEGRSYLNVSSVSGSFGAGAVFEALPKALWIGASYQSRPNISGGMVLKGTLKSVFGPGQASTVDATLTQDLPDIIRIGARYRPLEDIELRLFGDISRWSAFKDQCIGVPDKECAVNEDGSAVTPDTVTQNIPRRWNDAFGVRAGLSYFASESAEVYSGLGYDGNAVPDGTLEAGLTDFHDISVSVGGRFRVIEQLHLGLGYTHIFYVTRDNTGNSDLGPGAAGGYQSPSIVPDAGGIYTQTVGVLNINVEAAF